MREAWTRLSPVPALAPAEAAELLRPLAPGARVLSVTPLGGHTNANYRLEVAGGSPLLLRLALREGSSLVREAAVARRAGERIPVVRTHYLADTNPVNGHPYAVNEWIDGSTLAAALRSLDPPDPDALGRHLGSVLVGIHGFEFARAGFLDERLEVVEPLDLGASGFLALVQEWVVEGPGRERLGAASTEALWELLRAQAGCLDDLEPSSCLVHADFDVENVMVARGLDGWKVSAVLDWEFALAGPAVMDLGHVVRPPLDGEAFARALGRGYEAAGGRLPPRWRARAALMDLMAWCHFLGRAELPEPIAESARQRVAATIERWPRLWADGGP